MKKRILALLLVCALLFSMVPAFAYETTFDYKSTFTDVSSDSWYAPYVIAANHHGFMTGTGNNRFEPEAVCTRAQIVQTLYAIVEKPEVDYDSRFVDVPDGQWYSSAVSWAVKNGITSGTDATHFSPDETVTRQQIATFLYVGEGRPHVTGSLSDYPDEADVADWAYDALLWATQTGIMSGSSESGAVLLLPEAPATRAQVATILVALYNYEFGLPGETEYRYNIDNISADPESGQVMLQLCTIDSGILTVQLRADDNKTVIDEVSVTVAEKQLHERTYIEFPTSEFPEYYYIYATLTDADGNQLCTSFTYDLGSSAYEKMMSIVNGSS